MTTAPRDPAEVLTRTPPPYGVRVEYGDQPSQFADVRLPEDEYTRAPLAIVIHGGYWRSRYDLSHLGHLAQALADDGIATCNLEYRRAGEPGGGFPGTFDDIRAGMMLALSLAARHPIDPARPVIVGHPAGGHLALLLGTRHATRVPVVALAPVSNLYEGGRLGHSNGAVTQFLDGTPETHPERYAFACPSHQSEASATQWILHGTADTAVPVDLATRHSPRRPCTRSRADHPSGTPRRHRPLRTDRPTVRCLAGHPPRHPNRARDAGRGQ